MPFPATSTCSANELLHSNVAAALERLPSSSFCSDFFAALQSSHPDLLQWQILVSWLGEAEGRGALPTGANFVAGNGSDEVVSWEDATLAGAAASSASVAPASSAAPSTTFFFAAAHTCFLLSDA
jgi:hypothetical protein